MIKYEKNHFFITLFLFELDGNMVKSLSLKTTFLLDIFSSAVVDAPPPLTMLVSLRFESIKLLSLLYVIGLHTISFIPFSLHFFSISIRANQKRENLPGLTSAENPHMKCFSLSVSWKSSSSFLMLDVASYPPIIGIMMSIRISSKRTLEK